MSNRMNHSSPASEQRAGEEKREGNDSAVILLRGAASSRRSLSSGYVVEGLAFHQNKDT